MDLERIRDQLSKTVWIFLNWLIRRRATLIFVTKKELNFGHSVFNICYDYLYWTTAPWTWLMYNQWYMHYLSKVTMSNPLYLYTNTTSFQLFRQEFNCLWLYNSALLCRELKGGGQNKFKKGVEKDLTWKIGSFWHWFFYFTQIL